MKARYRNKLKKIIVELESMDNQKMKGGNTR